MNEQTTSALIAPGARRPRGLRGTAVKSHTVSGQDPTSTTEHKAVSERAAIWLWLSIAAALLAAAGSVIALAVDRIYAGLTPSFLPQALAQDVANLAFVSPALLLLAALALRGSLRAYLLWLGVLTFTVYNYVIYAFSIPFGPLFLLWVAVLGMCAYSLIGGVTMVDHMAVAARFSRRRSSSACSGSPRTCPPCWRARHRRASSTWACRPTPSTFSTWGSFCRPSSSPACSYSHAGRSRTPWRCRSSSSLC